MLLKHLSVARFPRYLLHCDDGGSGGACSKHVVNGASLQLKHTRQMHDAGDVIPEITTEGPAKDR